MTRHEVRWERMFPDELEAAFAACPVVYFPQGLDALKAHAVASLTARAHGGIVAPPDYWHIHEVAATPPGQPKTSAGFPAPG